MTAKDLMIGDWVQTKNGIIAKVIGISIPISTEYEEVVLESKDGKILYLSIEDIEPITLSKEILVTIGFENVNLLYLLHYDDNNIIYYNWANNHVEIGYSVSFEFVKKLDLYITSVHDLQHALHLCGLTELDDNLKI